MSVPSSRTSVGFWNFGSSKVQVVHLREQVNHEFGCLMSIQTFNLESPLLTNLFELGTGLGWMTSCLCVCVFKTLTIWSVCHQMQWEAAVTLPGIPTPCSTYTRRRVLDQTPSEPQDMALFVFMVNFVTAKLVQLLFLLPQQLPTGSSFWLFPQSVSG